MTMTAKDRRALRERVDAVLRARLNLAEPRGHVLATFGTGDEDDALLHRLAGALSPWSTIDLGEHLSFVLARVLEARAEGGTA